MDETRELTEAQRHLMIIQEFQLIADLYRRVESGEVLMSSEVHDDPAHIGLDLP